MLQHYNPAGQPFDAKAALTRTHSDSDHDITAGFDTSRCPSLVRESAGPERNDGQNVGWLALSGGTTLGVTWFTTSDTEADMALNTRFTWKNTLHQ